MVLPEEKNFSCNLCGKAFGRSEHLKRHELMHSQGDRPFKCQFCPKDFIRRDALQHHEATHNATPSLLQRGVRACAICSSAKARCSGEAQCTRCQERGLQCVYPGGVETPTSSTSDVATPAHISIVPQYQYPIQQHEPQTQATQPMPQNIVPMQEGNMTVGFDIWDQNILSSTNWLEVLEPGGYPQYNFDGFPRFFPVESSQQPAHLIPAYRANRSQAYSDSPGSVFSSHSNVIADSITSCGSHDEPPTPGEFYVDGEPARHPRVKRRKTSSAKRTLDVDGLRGPSLRLPDGFPSDFEQQIIVINDSTYTEIQNLYDRNCINPPQPWSPYEPIPLPAKEILGHFLDLHPYHGYGKYRLQYPPENAVSSVLVTSMHEMVRRCVLYVRESTPDPQARTIASGAAEVLHIVGAAFRGDKCLLDSAMEMRHHLGTIFADCARAAGDNIPATSANGMKGTPWVPWCQRESNIRLAYSAWMLDATIAYHFQLTPCLSLRDARLPLPCHEKLWIADTEQDWQALSTYSLQQPILNTALQELFVDKKLPRERGEFARILTIHGIYHRIWEVSRYLENPLSQWIPTASRQPSTELLPTAPVWLPSMPAFVKWQNSACDAIDVLHWQANATIGQASGLEHPTVLQLHFARTVVLATYDRMVSLVRHTASGTIHTVAAQEDQHIITRWANQHQCKARFAAIHAGVAFWHVRSYTIDASHEAPPVGLAALVLWAFGTFTSRKALGASASQQPGDHHTGNEHSEEAGNSDDAACDIILIDRPTDDELVQTFIRNGHKMQAHLTGVGDLYAPRGSERALAQACKLLNSLRCWAINESWLQLLQGLVNTLSHGHINGRGREHVLLAD
ncbi:hypothetical protein Slin15195_G023330 [Septoria linicola]|uniref:Uncharacterized protein n=1 Tax=Septoria linicola TaxID=215465 RepID=A0A9Q9AJG8_9PEZI|nr:hypothetical protein Slin15195_G023330 [Septoria linicola]